MTVATRAEADAEVRLAAGEEHRWTVEAAPADGAVIGVEFEARVDAPDLSGSMYFMELLVDGVPVDASIDRLRHRLRNKAAVIGGEPALAWQLPDIAWRVVYAPSFDPAHTGGHGPEGFRFVLDLDGLAHAGSTIAIRRRHVPFCDADLVVRGLRTIDLPGADEPPAGWVLADGTLHVTDDGAVQVGGGGGGGAGAVWRTNVRVGPAAGQIGPAGLELDGLRIDRRATIADGRVHVTDRLINTTDRDLGVVFEHALALPAPAPEVRLGGPETPGVVRTWAPWNPTLFAPLGPVSVGLVVEDDAQRAQCVYRYDGTTGTATARTERLVVGARGTVELTTALYALPHADYFDFATRIRQDWGVTVTLDGPYWWGWVPETVLHRSVDDLAEIITRTGITAAVTGGGWVDTLKGEADPRTIGFGVGVAHEWFADYRHRLAESVRLLRGAAPDLRIAVYDHMFLTTLEDEPEQFRDSWMMKSTTERQITSFAPEYKPGMGVVPTTDNSFGQAFAAEIGRQIDDLGFDGIYFDETNFPSGVLERSFSVGHWDGVSGTVDQETGKVVERVGYTWLLAREYQKRLFESLRDRGVWVLGNGQPHTTDANRETWPRFTETHATLLRAYEAHLYAPMAYSFGSWTMAEIRDRLRVGLVPCTTGPEDAICLVRHFFPITPTELHAGWMKGLERVIATEDGQYGWDGEFNYRLLRFDADGMALTPEEGAAESEVSVRVPEGGVAVLERRP